MTMRCLLRSRDQTLVGQKKTRGGAHRPTVELFFALSKSKNGCLVIFMRAEKNCLVLLNSGARYRVPLWSKQVIAQNMD